MMTTLGMILLRAVQYSELCVTFLAKAVLVILPVFKAADSACPLVDVRLDCVGPSRLG